MVYTVIVLSLCLFTTQFNETPLIFAAMLGHSFLVELLFSKGADPNLRDNVSHLITRWCCDKVCIIHCRLGKLRMIMLASMDILKSVIYY